MRLVDTGAKVSRFKKNLNMSKAEVQRNIFLLPYHRRYAETEKELKEINRLRVNETPHEMGVRGRKVTKLRTELRLLYKRLNKEWDEICDKLS